MVAAACVVATAQGDRAAGRAFGRGWDPVELRREMSTEEVRRVIERRRGDLERELARLDELSGSLEEGARSEEVQRELVRMMFEGMRTFREVMTGARRGEEGLGIVAGPRRGGERPVREVSEEELFEVLEAERPGVAERLRRLEAASPADFEAFVRRHGGRIVAHVERGGFLAGPRGRVPREARELARRAAGDGPDAAAARAELVEKVREEVDRRLDEAVRLIGELEVRLEMLRQDSEATEARREEMIERIVEGLIENSTRGG